MNTLSEALGESQRLGLLGDRPIDEVIDHARSFVEALAEVTGTVLDLGSGGGVPGLVVAADRPDLSVTLLDRRMKRTDFLERIVRSLGWSDRVRVLTADAARVAVETPFDAVVARGFGPPERTLRIAARFVVRGGLIVVSEPPSGDRWPPALLVDVGLTRRASDPRVACFEAPH